MQGFFRPQPSPFSLIGVWLWVMKKQTQDNPEIIPPHKTDALDQLEAVQAKEWQRFLQIESLATTMDAKFKIPGIPLPIGLDTIIGLVPGIGDTISLGVSGYIIAQAARFDLGSGTLFRMVVNIFLDWLIGLVPIIGDLFDWGWQGNLRNTRILKDKLEQRWDKQRADLLKS